MQTNPLQPHPEGENILLHDSAQASAWAGRLNVSEAELRRAVAAVGTSVEAVTAQLARSAGMRLSASGAVLGRPEEEYGAYGMVQGASGGESPSRDERAVRGLGGNTLPTDKT